MYGTNTTRYCGYIVKRYEVRQRRIIMCADDIFLALSQALKDRRQANSKIRKLRKDLCKELNALPYQQYLQTRHWKLLRSKALKKAKGKCQLCNASGQQLDVHHRTYDHKGRESLSDLIVLCHDCHSKFHGKGAC